MNRSYAIHGAKLASLFEILAEHGISKEKFLGSLGMAPSIFDAHEQKLTVDQVTRLLKTACQLTGEPDLGLHMGLRSRFLPNIVCYIMMNCPTVGQALSKYIRYKRIFNEQTRVQIRSTGKSAFLDINPISSQLILLRPFNDFLLTGMYMFLRFLTHGEFRLARVAVNYKQPKDISGYPNAFSSPVLFSQPANSLIFDRDVLNLPIQCPNKELLDHFESYARKRLNQISPKKSLTSRVTRLLIKLLQRGNRPSVELVARQMNMSTRKLQGLLEKEKTSYKTLLHTVRKELAILYLSDSQISSSEVSYLLGFSEPSSFYRAFKQWTGKTPKRYRACQ